MFTKDNKRKNKKELEIENEIENKIEAESKNNKEKKNVESKGMKILIYVLFFVLYITFTVAILLRSRVIYGIIFFAALFLLHFMWKEFDILMKVLLIALIIYSSFVAFGFGGVKFIELFGNNVGAAWIAVGAELLARYFGVILIMLIPAVIILMGILIPIFRRMCLDSHVYFMEKRYGPLPNVNRIEEGNKKISIHNNWEKVQVIYRNARKKRVLAEYPYEREVRYSLELTEDNIVIISKYDLKEYRLAGEERIRISGKRLM